ncbi:MAG: hypothetical protein ABJB47_21735 [Actinomycetota bacterium]
MRRQLPCLSAFRGGLAVVAVASAALAAAPASASPTAPTAAATTAAQAAPTRLMTAAARQRTTPARLRGIPARPLLLINGQQLTSRAGPGGKPVTSVLNPAAGSFSFIFIESFCAQSSDVPAAALPYLGRGLDPSLFQVSALRRQEKGGRLPVRVTYHGAGRPWLPGVTITRAAAGSATGFLTHRRRSPSARP